MGKNIQFGSDRNAGGLFASTVVLTMTVFGGLFAGLFAYPTEPRTILMITGGAVLLILLLAWLLRDRPQGTLRSQFGWLGRRQPHPHLDYEPRLIKEGRVRYGTNRPPTADEIRDLKDSDRNWVPANTPAGRRHQRRR